MKKSSTLYKIVFLLWTLCVGLLGFGTYQIITGLDGYSPVIQAFIIALLCLNSCILASLWFGSVKDFVFSVAYAVYGKKLLRRYEEVDRFRNIPSPEPKVLLLYCTRNDFNKRALSLSMRQNYKNFATVILDDSDQASYMEEIDAFASCHRNVEVIRRTNHSGYKAGNLNNYLSGRTDYDYFVVLDSDEVLPRDYIPEVLKYFNYSPRCGAVQTRHSAKNGENVFQRLMGLCVGSNGSTVQIIKNFYGANALIGHGMTISRLCYEKTGGFPLVVAEDISFAVDIKNAGFDIIYAPEIHCYEEFPVNYVSLKKRQCKWTQGNVEYMKKYGKEISDCKMAWFEKLDLRLSHYSLPIVPVLSLMLAVCTIILGFLGYPVIRYAFGIYAVMILFLCSPMIPDLFVYNRSKNAFLLIPYFLLNIATYASLAPMMLKTVFLGICGKKAVFLVTPKQSEKFTLGDAFRYTYDSLLFALAVGALCFFACGSLLPVMFIMIGCLVAPAIVLLSNIPVKKQKRQTVKLSDSKAKRAEKKAFLRKNSEKTVPSKMAERQ